MSFPPEMKEAAGFLCAEVPFSGGIEKALVGTCFFVTVASADGTQGFGYLVTAKHVCDELLRHRRAFVRLNKHTPIPGEPGVTYVELPNNWHYHSEPEVDIAVLPWADPEGGNYTAVSLPFENIVATPEFIRGRGGDWPPLEANPVIFVGLMDQHVGEDRNIPVVRRGHIACLSDEPIHGVYGASAHYLVEIQVYPGHSGGPVWVLIENTMFLLGVVSAGFPATQRVVESKKNKKGKIQTQIVEYVNLGVSLVAPVEKLVDILHSPAMEKIRSDQSPRPGRLFPVMYTAGTPTPKGASEGDGHLKY